MGLTFMMWKEHSQLEEELIFPAKVMDQLLYNELVFKETFFGLNI